MSLYPIITLDPTLAVNDMNPLPSGTLAVIPLDMSVVQMTQIVIAQVSLTQDYSLRAWVSASVDGLPAHSRVIPVMRISGLPFAIHTASQTPPDGTIAIQLEPGQYYVNVLNLTNEANVFIFSKTDLA